nr:winged helix-turn-helix domain-containing protein [Mangrovicoccus sp. HB161399]
MAVPDYQTLMRPVLQACSDSLRTVPEIVPRMAGQFGLSREDAEALLPSGKQTVIANRVHWARQYLSKAGATRSLKRGHFEITDLGRSLLAKHGSRIDNSVLRDLPGFAGWLDGNGNQGTSDPDGVTVAVPLPQNDETPQDLIDRAAAELDRGLAEDVLNAVLERSPIRFERLILDLLRAMGYGGGLDDMYRMTATTGDGGIDGVINEDALGLDAVYYSGQALCAGEPDRARSGAGFRRLADRGGRNQGCVRHHFGFQPPCRRIRPAGAAPDRADQWRAAGPPDDRP